MANGYQANRRLHAGANCVINGVTCTPCSSTANTRQRRLLSLQNPVEGSRFVTCVITAPRGTRNYNGMCCQCQSGGPGRPLQANYTFGHCIEDPLSDPKLRLGARMSVGTSVRNCTQVGGTISLVDGLKHPVFQWGGAENRDGLENLRNRQTSFRWFPDGCAWPG